MATRWLLGVAILAAGCDGPPPPRLATLLDSASGTAVEKAATGWLGRFSPGARAALAVRRSLLGSLRAQGSPAPAPALLFGLPGAGDRGGFWDALEPELTDPGTLLPSGGARRFPELSIGRVERDGPVVLTEAAQVQDGTGDPALVGAYRSGKRLLLLDAGGGYTLELGRAPLGGGSYRRVGGFVLLRGAGGDWRLRCDGEDLAASPTEIYRPLTEDGGAR